MFRIVFWFLGFWVLVEFEEGDVFGGCGWGSSEIVFPACFILVFEFRWISCFLLDESGFSVVNIGIGLISVLSSDTILSKFSPVFLLVDGFWIDFMTQVFLFIGFDVHDLVKNLLNVRFGLEGSLS